MARLFLFRHKPRGAVRAALSPALSNSQGAAGQSERFRIGELLRVPDLRSGLREVQCGSMSAVSQPQTLSSGRCTILASVNWSRASALVFSPKQDAKRFRGWHERGYLPHRDEPGLTQFVTFHLADSFPESLRAEWEQFAKIDGDREKRKLLEEYLDKGRGECHLRAPEIAKLVENNFRQFSGECRGSQTLDPGRAPRYELRVWSMRIMSTFFSAGTFRCRKRLVLEETHRKAGKQVTRGLFHC
jgi:hypothetical protein